MSEVYHYGVKGMKWGVRKETIKAARKEVNAGLKDIKRRKKAKELTREGAQAARAALRTSEAGLTANTLTRGEQVIYGAVAVTSLMTGTSVNILANNIAGR